MKVRFNETHRFTRQFEDIAQAEIMACPLVEHGATPEEIAASFFIPPSVKKVVADLPWAGLKHRWVYIRPQKCMLGDRDDRSGTFFHVDVDSIYRAVAPSWSPSDWRVMIVSFGDIAETEFIAEPFELDLDRSPRIGDYVNFSALFHGKTFKTESPRPGQLTEYSIRDFHRAGPIRRNGWRLAIVTFETNAQPVDRWPPEDRL